MDKKSQGEITWTLESCLCSVGINPPCWWCENTGAYECVECREEFLYYAGWGDPDFTPPSLCPGCGALSTTHFSCQTDVLDGALNALKNEDLKEAVLNEYTKQGKPKDLKEFINSLLSPELARMVIKKVYEKI